jgi:hypothetical protein
MDSKKEAWIVTVDMGYGHQRAAYPFKDIAYERIITANSDKIILPKEKKQWLRFQNIYESVSRMKSIPLIGTLFWNIYSKFQDISPLYPFRDLSKATIGTIYLDRLIKRNFIEGVVNYVKKKELPYVTTFFATAASADYHGIKDVYCIVTDSDINRLWAPNDSKNTKIIYFTPTERAKKRLIAYGVPEKNIFYTGFPLPEENTGKNLDILKADLAQRLINLDPKKTFLTKYGEIIKKELNLKSKSKRPLTLTFAVGGAGAQKEIAHKILTVLKNKIKEHSLVVNLVAGTRLEVCTYFKKIVQELELEDEIDKYVHILCALDKKSYFEQFNQLLRQTDILWTKPSELSFYTALGMPIIISSPIGAHESLNLNWLSMIRSGIPEETQEFSVEWFYDYLNNGIFAEAAWKGFTEAPKYGTYNIKNLIFSKDKEKVKLKY